jgi:hypothetical protein
MATMPISKETAMDIALAHREVETAEELLADIVKALSRRDVPDIRDAFGRKYGGLQLGVPQGNSGHTLFNVPWTLARPVIEAHIAQQRSIIAALNEKARLELDGGSAPEGGAA